jgi:hypothetical protein
MRDKGKWGDEEEIRRSNLTFSSENCSKHHQETTYENE